MKTSSLTPRSVDAAGLSLCVAIVAAFYFLAAGPLLSRQADARAAADSIKDENDRIGRLTASLRQSRQSINATSEKLSKFGASLQRAESVNDRISSLVELAKSLGLQLAETTPGSPRQGKEFDAIPVRLGGRGTLTSLAAFLDTLHNKLADVAIESLEIRGGSAGSRDNAAGVEFSLLLTSYVEHAVPVEHADHAAHTPENALNAPADPNDGNADAGTPSADSPESP